MPRGIPKTYRDLPARRCLNCGRLYKPTVPWQRFCRRAEGGSDPDRCRKQYHEHGGAYHKLKPQVEQLVHDATREHLRELEERVERLEQQTPAAEPVPVA